MSSPSRLLSRPKRSLSSAASRPPTTVGCSPNPIQTSSSQVQPQPELPRTSPTAKLHQRQISTTTELRSDSYGSQTSSLTLIAGRLRSDSYGSQISSPTPATGRLRPDSYGSRTSSPTSMAGRLRSDSHGSQASSPTSIAGKLRPAS